MRGCNPATDRINSGEERGSRLQVRGNSKPTPTAKPLHYRGHEGAQEGSSDHARSRRTRASARDSSCRLCPVAYCLGFPVSSALSACSAVKGFDFAFPCCLLPIAYSCAFRSCFGGFGSGESGCASPSKKLKSLDNFGNWGLATNPLLWQPMQLPMNLSLFPGVCWK